MGATDDDVRPAGEPGARAQWQRVERIYLAVLERPTPERPALLAALCAGNATLRRDVEALLAHAPAADGFIETPAVAVVADMLDGASSVDLAGRHDARFRAAVQSLIERAALGRTMGVGADRREGRSRRDHTRGSILGALLPRMKDHPQIGRYELIEPLGAGGMGEVYKGLDPHLRRAVAIKLLPDDVAQDPGRRKRLLEEARAAGSLSHPNILSVFDVGVEGDTPFIVTELLDGRELREEMNRAPLPIKRLLALATQIAAGLARAHEAAIVHRDLKPENVMVTRDGRVKIVDFGLAKSYAPSPAHMTRTTVSVPGLIEGTPQYMSPEQASGGHVDYRSDQFSLGVILYEAVTGVHPFRRDTAVQTMSAIVADDIRPIAELNDKVPTALRWIIERCTAKDPADRYASTADLHKDLALLQDRLPELGEDSRRVVVPYRSRVALPLAVAAVIATLAVTAALVPRASEGLPHLRFTPLVTDAPFQGSPSWSPDGGTLAYVAMVDGILQVFTRSLASPLPHKVTDSRFDCTDPFWSPDGTRIYYHSLARASESLWSVSAAGGPPRLVVENATQAAISPDGRTLAFFRESDQTWGQRLLGASKSIWLAAPDGADLRRYPGEPFDGMRTFTAGTVRFAPDGSKLLAWVWGWEGDTLVPSPEFWLLPYPAGRANRVLPGLARETAAAATFDWLPDGRRIVLSLWDEAATRMHLWLADTTTGTLTPLTTTPGSENRPAVSRDGTRVAFASEAVDFDLIEVPLSGDPARNLLATSLNELDPTFNAAGTQFAYVADKGGVLQIWLRSRDGQFERPVVSAGQFPEDATLALGAPALAPDGQRIAYQRYGDRTGYTIWISTLAAAGPPVRLTTGARYEDAPTWSPDGDWIAFIERTGVDNLPALSKARVGVSAPSEVLLEGTPTMGSRPQWSPDGRWIAADTSEGLVVVSPDGGEPRVVSEDIWIAYAWSADSRQIYGFREGDRPRHYALVAIDIDTQAERVINAEVGVIPPAGQPIRGLSRLGETMLVTSVARARSDIWMAEGLPVDRGLFARLWR